MKVVEIEWDRGSPSGAIHVQNGRIDQLTWVNGSGKTDGNGFDSNQGGSHRLRIALDECNVNYGPHATILNIREAEKPFSFFLRDVHKSFPIYLPALGAVVTESGDSRSYEEIAGEIQRKGLQTARQRFEDEPEEDFDTAMAETRPTICPTWLGLGRDIRIFEVDFPKAYKGAIRPRLHNSRTSIAEWDNQPLHYTYAFGRGELVSHKNERWLEDGVLPILHGTIPDDDIRYDISTFVTLEQSPLNASTVRGTPYLVAYANGIGATLTDEHKKLLETQTPEALEEGEQTVLYLRARAVNSGSVPRYAWFLAPVPGHAIEGWSCPAWSADEETGFCQFESGNVFCIMRLNGSPLDQSEMSVLLMPGETATFEFILPHRPIPQARAEKVAQQSFDTRLAECRDFWRGKLAAGATVRVPEKRIDEMIRAGLLHLDLVAYGREPDGPVAACTGMYTPIGTESAPIIQFIDSMGHHDLARRALMFFLEIQREDGSMVAFSDYLIETGAVLWNIGEHYRYTRDDDWVREITPKLLRTCDYLIAWRDRNKDESLRGKGYGMIDGQTCDYNDPYRHFILNGYATLGLSRVSDMLSGIDPRQSARLAGVVEEWKQDIRESLHACMARSPVVPLSDGSWCPTAPPWAEGCGPVAIFADEIDWYSPERWKYYNRTGAQFWVRDSMLGPQYLMFQEILDPEEPAAEWLHQYHTDLFARRNVMSCQPYYSRHPWVHLVRGEVKAFLKAHYNCAAAQSDRETYSFPEGIVRSVFAIEKDSPHKTHEEGWFLLQTRWMLYMEDGDTLHLLPGVPREWLAAGKTIELNDVATYFGPVSLKVESSADGGSIRAVIECRSDRQPARVDIRLPHSGGNHPTAIEGGTFERERERVVVEGFKDRAEISLTF